MTINTKKTEVIFFGNKAHLKKLDNKTVRYLDTPLKRKDKVKYLGVLFDEKMQWKYQIKNITQKATLREESNAEKSPAEQKNAELKNANLVQNSHSFIPHFSGILDHSHSFIPHFSRILDNRNLLFPIL